MKILLSIIIYGFICAFDVLAQEHQIVKNVEVFLHPEDHSFLGRPTIIDADSTGFLIADRGYMRITKVDYKGNLLFHFGGEGRGPGEFESITGFWVLEDIYFIYDYNNFKFLNYDNRGNLISEHLMSSNPFNPESEYAIPITLQALSPNLLTLQVLGRNGALFAVADIMNNKVSYVGKAIVESEPMSEYEVDRAYARGEIPHNYKNFVMLEGYGQYIYCFQQTTGILQKYTLKGSLVWSTEISVPSQEELFEQISEYNVEKKNDSFVHQYFFRARDMDINNDGIAILLNMPDEQPLKIAWVTDDGRKVKFLTVSGLFNDRYGINESFTISPDNEYAYYLKRSTGIVYRFKWTL